MLKIISFFFSCIVFPCNGMFTQDLELTRHLPETAVHSEQSNCSTKSEELISHETEAILQTLDSDGGNSIPDLEELILEEIEFQKALDDLMKDPERSADDTHEQSHHTLAEQIEHVSDYQSCNIDQVEIDRQSSQHNSLVNITSGSQTTYAEDLVVDPNQRSSKAPHKTQGLRDRIRRLETHELVGPAQAIPHLNAQIQSDQTVEPYVFVPIAIDTDQIMAEIANHQASSSETTQRENISHKERSYDSLPTRYYDESGNTWHRFDGMWLTNEEYDTTLNNMRERAHASGHKLIDDSQDQKSFDLSGAFQSEITASHDRTSIESPIQPAQEAQPGGTSQATELGVQRWPTDLRTLCDVADPHEKVSTLEERAAHRHATRSQHRQLIGQRQSINPIKDEKARLDQLRQAMHEVNQSSEELSKYAIEILQMEKESRNNQLLRERLKAEKLFDHLKSYARTVREAHLKCHLERFSKMEEKYGPSNHRGTFLQDMRREFEAMKDGTSSEEQNQLSRCIGNIEAHLSKIKAESTGALTSISEDVLAEFPVLAQYKAQSAQDAKFVTEVSDLVHDIKKTEKPDSSLKDLLFQGIGKVFDYYCVFNNPFKAKALHYYLSNFWQIEKGVLKGMYRRCEQIGNICRDPDIAFLNLEKSVHKFIGWCDKMGTAHYRLHKPQLLSGNYTQSMRLKDQNTLRDGLNDLKNVYASMVNWWNNATSEEIGELMGGIALDVLLIESAANALGQLAEAASGEAAFSDVMDLTPQEFLNKPPREILDMVEVAPNTYAMAAETTRAMLPAITPQYIAQAAEETAAALESALAQVSSLAEQASNVSLSITNPALKVDQANKTISAISNPVTENIRSGSALKTDAYHSFNDIIDNYASYAQQFEIVGKDGQKVLLFQLRGSLNGKDGIFEWILHPNEQKGVTHRLFIAEGNITGLPNARPK